MDQATPTDPRIDSVTGRWAGSPDKRSHITEILRGNEPLRSGMAVETRAADEGETAPNGELFHVEIKASTSRIARDGGVIPLSAWGRDLSNFQANPVILFAHNSWDPPIAKAVDVKVDMDAGALMQWWLFHDESELSRLTHTLFERGFMRAASVGFIVKAWKTPDELEEEELEAILADIPPAEAHNLTWIATRAELLETSAVPVPADPFALSVGKAFDGARAAGVAMIAVEKAWSGVEKAWSGAQERATSAAKIDEAGGATNQATDDLEDQDVTTDEVREIVDDVVKTALDTISERLERVEAALLAIEEHEEKQAAAGQADAGDTAGDGDGDRAGDTAGDGADDDSVEIEIECKEGETPEQALDRTIDELAKSAVEKVRGAA